MAESCPVPFPFLGNVLSTDWFFAIRARLATVIGTLAFGVAARRRCGRLRHSLALTAAIVSSRFIVRVSGEPSAHFAHKTRQLKRG